MGEEIGVADGKGAGVAEGLGKEVGEGVVVGSIGVNIVF
jgi:hypothetical protein